MDQGWANPHGPASEATLWARGGGSGELSRPTFPGPEHRLLRLSPESGRWGLGMECSLLGALASGQAPVTLGTVRTQHYPYAAGHLDTDLIIWLLLPKRHFAAESGGGQAGENRTRGPRGLHSTPHLVVCPVGLPCVPSPAPLLHSCEDKFILTSSSLSCTGIYLPGL